MKLREFVHRLGIKLIDRELDKKEPDLGKRIPMYFIRQLISPGPHSEDEIKCFKKLKAYVQKHPDEVPESIRELLYSPLEEVPVDIRPLILAHLDSKNQASLAQTSSTVNEMVKEHKANEWRDRFNELSDIKKLFKERLEGNKEAEDAFKALSLPTVKIGANSTQEECRKEAEKLHDQIISALTKVNDETLEDLLEELRNVNKEDRHKPIYYKSGWRDKRSLYKQADFVKQLPDDGDTKNIALRAIAENLAEARDFKGAIDLANTITDEREKNYALRAIAKNLAEARDFKGAIDLANTITDDRDEKSEALKDIAKNLAEARDFKGAIDLANTITDNMYQSACLQTIAIEMVKSGWFKDAKDFVNAIPEGNNKIRYLRAIAILISQLGKIEEAKKIAAELPDGYDKDSALGWIAINERDLES